MVIESAPKSTLRVLGIFDVISQASGGLTLAKLSLLLESPKSSLLNLLRPLVAQDYLSYGNGVYTLGPRAFSLASGILGVRKQPSLIRQFAHELAEATHETVIVAALDLAADLAAYVDVIESPQLVRYSVPAGVTRPLYCSAAGRLLLAFQPESWRDAYFERAELKPLTARTVTKVPELRTIIAEIRRTNIAYSSNEAVDGAAGIAAPVCDADGTVVAALLVAAPAMRAEQNRAHLRQEVIRAAARASQALGHREAEAVA
ncbi:IclR family transcriptional regulator C-terminal domain-containing protein [Xanthobacter dioxanivorans]|jgi:IclR family transcriptional regulator, acetate operon repressor|uniref:Helix-turn-helix domain-containing protein n=1 Tax=Xanthobacter dioxanivorans TaxID=2528964 RepID=A0A974SJW2_9HYPH|nr:helix-turn-helix domain-containing protein [Xanthobacter dioxanivorans]